MMTKEMLEEQERRKKEMLEKINPRQKGKQRGRKREE